MLVVKRPFVGHGFNMPNPGDLIDPPADIRAHLLAIGVAERYETKVDPLPEVKKKAKPSASSRAGQAQRKKTRKRSKKSATKS